MEIQELIMVIVATLAGIISLILVLLQKRGIIKPTFIQVKSRIAITTLVLSLIVVAWEYMLS